MYAFSVYQAQIRQVPFQYQYVPPLPRNLVRARWQLLRISLAVADVSDGIRLLCLPDLYANLIIDPRAITSAVGLMPCVYGAQLSYLELQNWNAAKFYQNEFDMRTLGYSTQARPGRNSESIRSLLMIEAQHFKVTSRLRTHQRGRRSFDVRGLRGHQYGHATSGCR